MYRIAMRSLYLRQLSNNLSIKNDKICKLSYHAKIIFSTLVYVVKYLAPYNSLSNFVNAIGVPILLQFRS